MNKYIKINYKYYILLSTSFTFIIAKDAKSSTGYEQYFNSNILQSSIQRVLEYNKDNQTYGLLGREGWQFTVTPLYHNIASQNPTVYCRSYVYAFIKGNTGINQTRNSCRNNNNGYWGNTTIVSTNQLSYQIKGGILLHDGKGDSSYRVVKKKPKKSFCDGEEKACTLLGIGIGAAVGAKILNSRTDNNSSRTNNSYDNDNDVNDRLRRQQERLDSYITRDLYN